MREKCQIKPIKLEKFSKNPFPTGKDQPGLKFANPGGSGGDIHGLLPSTQHNLQGRETRGITTLQCSPLGFREFWDH